MENRALHAIVVLPPGLGGQIQDRRLRRWLSKGQLRVVEPEEEILYTVTGKLGLDARSAGLAALKFWGQTGERSGAWMAAADPVNLEARLDHLYLHDLRGENLPMSELRPIFDYLQTTFGSEKMAFARIGRQGYLRGEEVIATAAVSARQLDGMRPDDWMPSPETGRAATDYHRLLSEVQMSLHEHEVNLRRLAAGKPEINSLWIWGGGKAPEAAAKPILPLFTNDPIFKGFWLSCTGLIKPWSDDFHAVLKLAQKGFVAVAPELVAGKTVAADRYLLSLKALLAAGSLGRLTLLFRDGLQVEIQARDKWRIWRRESPLLMPLKATT